MTDREKLVALIKEGDCSSLTYGECSRCKYGCKGDCSYQFLADHLLANGVTFATDNRVGSKWIPVTERLPDNKEHDWVLVQVVEDNGFRHIPQVMEYRQNINDWYGETYGWISGHNGAFIVTHWMPLPEPPMRKGENG